MSHCAYCSFISKKGKLGLPGEQVPHETEWRDAIMKLHTLSMTIVLLTFSLTAQVMAAPPEGKGGGKPKDGNSGGDGSLTPSPIAMLIEFRDDSNDTVRSDSSDYEWNQPDGLRAHIDGDSGGNYGNLYLYFEPEVGRSVFLDIESGSVDDSAALPFTARSFDRVGIKVIAAETVSDGVCGMAPGDEISARMNIKFHDEQQYNTAGPGVIAFQTYNRKKHPCYRATSMVQVKRGEAGTALENSWTVSSDVAACITWPDGRTHGGISYMPFSFTATVINPDNPDEPVCE